MAKIRVVLALASVALLSAACSKTTPTSPTPEMNRAASASTTTAAARMPPRALAPRPSEGPGLVGTWGGDRLNLTIGMTGGVLEYDCAHGTIDVAFATDAEGRFDLAGTHVPEYPGPIRDDKPPIVHPARYSGSTDETTMTLKVALTDTGDVLGPYRLTRGTAVHIVKCL